MAKIGHGYRGGGGGRDGHAPWWRPELRNDVAGDEPRRRAGRGGPRVVGRERWRQNVLLRTAGRGHHQLLRRRQRWRWRRQARVLLLLLRRLLLLLVRWLLLMVRLLLLGLLR